MLNDHPTREWDVVDEAATPAMNPDALLRPVIQDNSRDAPVIIHDHLRRQILSGELEPGCELSQSRVAADFGVSRGPVREAFRLLQRDGLIDAEVNQRAKITPLSVPDVEHVYALRIVDEDLALSVGISQFSTVELDELDRRVAAVDDAREQGYHVWERTHQSFHDMLLMHSGARMRRSLSEWADQTERCRRVYVARQEGGWSLGAPEHALMVEACRARDLRAATTLLARHLSRAALSLVATMDPEHDPALVRNAVRQVTGS